MGGDGRHPDGDGRLRKGPLLDPPPLRGRGRRLPIRRHLLRLAWTRPPDTGNAARAAQKPACHMLWKWKLILGSSAARAPAAKPDTRKQPTTKNLCGQVGSSMSVQL